MKKQRFIIVDGNAMMHRAWHALPPLKTQKGEIVNAIYGFTTILLKAIKDIKPTHIAVCFDYPAKNYRHELFKEYKGQRVRKEPEFYSQFPRLKELLQALNFKIYEKEGYEADDLIGTLAKSKLLDKNPDVENIILTGDMDTLQLVDENTKIYTLKRGINDIAIYDRRAVAERFDGLKPEQLIDYKALRGDPSDNIPGVPGIGEKTAMELINEFKSLDNLYKNLNKVQRESVREKLTQNKDAAYLSKKLVTLQTNAPLNFIFNDCLIKEMNQAKVVELLQEFEFKSLLSRIQNLGIEKSQSDHQEIKKERIKLAKKYLLLKDKDLAKFMKGLEKQKIFCFDTETTDLNPFKAKLLGISFCWKQGESYFMPADLFNSEFKRLKEIFENPKIKKIGHNMKYDMDILLQNGIEVMGAAFDTMIASYLLNPGTRAHDLDTAVFTHLGHQMIPLSELMGEKKKGQMQLTLDIVPQAKLAEYSCEDADFTFRLSKYFDPLLKKDKTWQIFEKIEMPLIPVLINMENNGVKLDLDFIEKMSKKAEKELEKVEKDIYKMAGEKFNINSPLQLKEILFDKLKIESGDLRKIKTGISTAAAELEKMKGRHPIIELISLHRELAKLISTYINALPKLVEEKTGRVHTNFNQTITATGRLSSSDPNLQNIPIKTEMGRELRKAFIAERGYKLIAADYSQIELRVVASLANDKNMISIFKKGGDIHTQTASKIFKVKPEDVTKEMRREAKTINFGITYGMSAFGLSESVGINVHKAQEFIDKYFSIFSGVKKFLEKQKDKAHDLGYVETLFGRKRFLPEINSNVIQIKNQAERMAINHPVQGTAADLIKLAMIKLHDELKKIDSDDVKMLLQVHDELVFEVREDKIKEVGKIIEDCMESVHKLKVPVKVDIECGDNWEEMEKI